MSREDIERGQKAQAALNLLTEHFAGREDDIITEMTREIDTLTPTRALAYAGQLSELRRFIKKLERERDQGIRALNDDING